MCRTFDKLTNKLSHTTGKVFLCQILHCHDLMGFESISLSIPLFSPFLCICSSFLVELLVLVLIYVSDKTHFCFGLLKLQSKAEKKKRRARHVPGVFENDAACAHPRLSASGRGYVHVTLRARTPDSSQVGVVVYT